MNSTAAINTGGNRNGRPPIPSATFPFSTNGTAGDLQSAEAKVWKAGDDTASNGTASKKKNKRSAYTAATESSPNPQLSGIDIHTTTKMTDPVPNQIVNASSDVSSAPVYDAPITSEMDGMVPGGMFLEDPFGAMTLDEEVEVAQQQMGVTTRPGSLESFPTMQTPQQQHYFSSVGGNGFQDTPSPLSPIEKVNPAKVIHRATPPHNHNTYNTLFTHPINTPSDASSALIHRRGCGCIR